MDWRVVGLVVFGICCMIGVAWNAVFPQSDEPPPPPSYANAFVADGVEVLWNDGRVTYVQTLARNSQNAEELDCVNNNGDVVVEDVRLLDRETLLVSLDLGMVDGCRPRSGISFRSSPTGNGGFSTIAYFEDETPTGTYEVPIAEGHIFVDAATGDGGAIAYVSSR